MNEQLSVREPSMGVVYRNTERTRSKPLMATTTTLFQKLKEVRHELKQVKKERDKLKIEILNNIQIF